MTAWAGRWTLIDAAIASNTRLSASSCVWVCVCSHPSSNRTGKNIPCTRSISTSSALRLGCIVDGVGLIVTSMVGGGSASATLGPHTGIEHCGKRNSSAAACSVDGLLLLASMLI